METDWWVMAGTLCSLPLFLPHACEHFVTHVVFVIPFCYVALLLSHLLVQFFLTFCRYSQPSLFPPPGLSQPSFSHTDLPSVSDYTHSFLICSVRNLPRKDFFPLVSRMTEWLNARQTHTDSQIELSILTKSFYSDNERWMDRSARWNKNEAWTIYGFYKGISVQ